MLGLRVCDNRDGWLVFMGWCGCVLSRFSTVWLLPRAEPHYTTDTTHLSGDTQRPPPHLGGPSSGVADGKPRAHGLLLSKGRGRGGGAAPQTQTPERAASADPGARMARAGAETSGKTIRPRGV